jgi:hypothetical protein
VDGLRYRLRGLFGNPEDERVQGSLPPKIANLINELGLDRSDPLGPPPKPTESRERIRIRTASGIHRK